MTLSDWTATRPGRRSLSPGSPRRKHYAHDDAGYLIWVSQHPGGFVIDTYTRPSRAYLKLHQATCPSISRLQPGARTFTGGAVQQDLRHPRRTRRKCPPPRRKSRALPALPLISRALVQHNEQNEIPHSVLIPGDGATGDQDSHNRHYSEKPPDSSPDPQVPGHTVARNVRSCRKQPKQIDPESKFLHISPNRWVPEGSSALGGCVHIIHSGFPNIWVSRAGSVVIWSRCHLSYM